MMPCSVPTTVMFKGLFSSWAAVGLITNSTIDQTDLDRPQGGYKRNIGKIEGGRGPDDPQGVGLVFQVGRKKKGDDLGVEEVPIREEGTDRSVDQAADQDLPLGRAAFPFEEASGDLSGGIGIFSVIDDQGQKRLRLLDLFLRGRGAQHDRLAQADQGRAVGLTADLADLNREGRLLISRMMVSDIGVFQAGGAYLRRPSLLISCS